MQNERVLTLALQLCGATMIVLSFAHLYLYRLLGWKDDVAKLTPINSEIFWAHAAFIAIGIGLLGLVCGFAPSTLIEKSALARLAATCFAMCWASRLVMQFAWFRGRLSKADRVERALRVGGTLLWILYCTVFGALSLHQWS